MIPVTQFYNEVINDVIESVRADFAEEEAGDPQILEDLKNLWHSKLFGNNKSEESSATTATPNKKGTKDLGMNMSFRRSNSESGTNEYKHFTIAVPTNFKDETEIVKKLPCDVLQKVINLPHELASKVLQKAVDNIVAQKSLPQLDGPEPDESDNSATASSSSCSSVSIGPGDEEANNTSAELNTDDDISDEDSEDQETENTVLCQYEKVLRRANRWRFVLKNGIMQINGHDYVFSKMCGSAVW